MPKLIIRPKHEAGVTLLQKYENMATCVFGIFIFGTNSSVIYRFLTDGLVAHLKQCFQERGYKLMEDNPADQLVSRSNRSGLLIFREEYDWILQENEDSEPALIIDDAISQHLSTLIRVYEQTASRSDPIRRITLASGVQVYFDQVITDGVLSSSNWSKAT